MYEAVVITLGFVVDLIALYFLVGIWKDDRLMRIAAEKSLEAQKEYLGLRRKWYESRIKKKTDASPEQKGTLGISNGSDQNDV